MNIDQIQINFSQDSLLILNICLSIMMFGIAMDLQMKDFSSFAKNPKPVLVGLSSQYILLPILTLLLVYLWQPHPSIGLGLILVASCPGGNISNFAVHYGNGNAALSITMTSIVTVLSTVMTPLIFYIGLHFMNMNEMDKLQISVSPYEMVKIVLLIVFLPLILGMYIRFKFEGMALKLKTPVQRISLLIFAVFIVMALLGNLSQIGDYLHIVFWMVIAHNVLGIIMGYSWAKFWKLGTKSARAIGMETGVQNAGLGLVLIFNFFSDLGGMMLVAAWWGIWSLISAFSLSLWWHYRSPDYSKTKLR